MHPTYWASGDQPFLSLTGRFGSPSAHEDWCAWHTTIWWHNKCNIARSFYTTLFSICDVARTSGEKSIQDTTFSTNVPSSVWLVKWNRQALKKKYIQQSRFANNDSLSGQKLPSVLLPLRRTIIFTYCHRNLFVLMLYAERNYQLCIPTEELKGSCTQHGRKRTWLNPTQII